MVGWSQDPRDEIQGGQWRGVVGGVHFAGEAAGYGVVAARSSRGVSTMADIFWELNETLLKYILRGILEMDGNGRNMHTYIKIHFERDPGISWNNANRINS